MLEVVAVVLITTVVVLALGMWFLKMYGYQGLYNELNTRYNELMTALIQSEAQRKLVTEQYQILKGFIDEMRGKPILASLGDAQISMIAHQVATALRHKDEAKKLEN